MTNPAPAAFGTTTAATAACAVIGKIASNPNSVYYRSLDKPSWNPPDMVFPIVWSTLYTDIAATTGHALTKLRRAGRSYEARNYLIALGTNLVLNASWSAVFFRTKQRALSAVWAAALTASSVDLVRRTHRISEPAALALAPYAGWTAFATALSTSVWLRNR